MEKPRLLIVDDDLDFAESLAMILEDRGYEVDTVHNGEEAIRRFQEHEYSVTFMDVKMPGMNGVESFLEIRKLEPKARVVMMTGYSVEDLLKQAVENGAWGVLNKPFDMGKMIEFITRMEKGRVLVVDDDPSFVESLRHVLESRDLEVFSCENGKAAIDHVRSKGAGMLILDLRMPVMDGLETYQALKDAGYEIPTIIVTAYADEEKESIKEFSGKSVKGILHKPFNPEKILRVIDELSAD